MRRSTRKEFNEAVRARHPELDCFPAAVRRVALKNNLLLNDVIERSGISSSSFFSYMQSGRDSLRAPVPRIDSFFAVADGLGVSVEDLLKEMRAIYEQNKE